MYARARAHVLPVWPRVDGANVGTIVGVDVARSVGGSVGGADGVQDGSNVGAVDGMAVGTAVNGAAVGCRVGVPDRSVEHNILVIIYYDDIRALISVVDGMIGVPIGAQLLAC